MSDRLVAGTLLLVVAAAGAACVSRNVERISAEEAATMAPPPAPLSPEQRAATEAATPGVEGTIRLADELAGRSPEGTLFAILRVSGRQGGPPLAVKRLLPEFPQSFRITEEDAMIPGTPLAGDLDLVVRLDQDGNAFTQEPGDLEGRVGPVQVGATVEVVLRPAGGGDAPGR